MDLQLLFAGLVVVVTWGYFLIRTYSIFQKGSAIFTAPLGIPNIELSGIRAVLMQVWILPVPIFAMAHFLWCLNRSTEMYDYREIMGAFMAAWMLGGVLIYLLVRFLKYLGVKI